jgi:hypothetical protein
MLDLRDKAVIIVDYTNAVNVDTSNSPWMERRIFTPVDFLYNSAAMRMDCTELSISHFSI